MRDQSESDLIAAHWQQWRQRCAAKLCNAEAQAYFYGFAMRFGSKLRNLSASHLAVPAETAVDCGQNYWHEFEYQMHVVGAQSQHRYKDHIITLLAKCGDSTQQAAQTERYVSRIFSRLAVKMWKDDSTTKLLRHTGQYPISLDAPTTGDDGSRQRTVAETVSDDSGMHSFTEGVDDLADLARTLAEDFMATLGNGERLVLFGYIHHISMATSAVWDHLPVPGRDARYSLIQSLGLSVTGQVRKQFPRESDDGLRVLARQVMRCVMDLILNAQIQEEHREVFFKYLEND